MIQIEPGAEPSIDFDHIDGALLHTSTGAIHWLTLFERFALFIGAETLQTLDEKYK